VEIRRVTADRVATIADVLGRALATEPMMTWPLGGDEFVVERCIRQLTVIDTPLVEAGMVWEAADGLGAATWVPPLEHQRFWSAIDATDAAQRALTDDDGHRMDRLWNWVASVIPEEPLWLLDHIGVDPAHQGQGVGAALIDFGLSRARHDGVDAYLETGSERNIAYYQRFGFQVVEHGTVPGDGIPVWFLRWTA
jgi:GNAT superfamily N-acetyltransferase